MWNNNLQEIAWHITKFIQTHADSFIDGNLDFDSFELLPMFHSLNKRLEGVFDEFKCYK